MKKDGRKIDAVSLRFMKDKCFYLFAVLLLISAKGWTAPQHYQQSYPIARPAPPSQGEDLAGVLRLLKNGLTDLQHEMQNHESEIRVFDNKIQGIDTSFEHFKQQLTNDIQSQRDFVRATNVNLEGKTETLSQSMKNLETLFRGLMADVRQIKTQANDSVAVLGQYKQKMTELEGLVQTQNQHMQNLEAALKSMMEVWEAKEAVKEISNQSVGEGKLYKVQSGDSLEKIARIHKVPLQALRDANQLNSDRIIVGQTLRIP